MIIYLCKNGTSGHMAFMTEPRAKSHLKVCSNRPQCVDVEQIIFCTFKECLE